MDGMMQKHLFILGFISCTYSVLNRLITLGESVSYCHKGTKKQSQKTSLMYKQKHFLAHNLVASYRMMLQAGLGGIIWLLSMCLSFSSRGQWASLDIPFSSAQRSNKGRIWHCKCFSSRNSLVIFHWQFTQRSPKVKRRDRKYISLVEMRCGEAANISNL